MPAEPPPPAGGTLQRWRARVADAWADGPWRVAGAVVAVVVAGAVAVWWLRPPSLPPPEVVLPTEPPATAPASTEPDAVVVHAAGAVARPGLYRVRGGARVADVVDAAGGPTSEADLDRLNLAAKVADGERVYVPRRGEPAPPPAAGDAPTGAQPAASGPVNLNTATAADLEALPGVGPATARAIVDHRTHHGPFRKVDDLLSVRGIGPARLSQLRGLVTV